MLYSPFESSYCVGHHPDKVAAAIITALVRDPSNAEYRQFQKGDANKGPSICLITGKLDEVPPFGHPIVIAYNGRYDENNRGYHGGIEFSKYPQDKKEFPENFYVDTYVDVRAFTRIERDQTITVTSKSDFDLHILRGILTQKWILQGPTDFLSLGAFPCLIFSRWISDQITRKLSLPPMTHLQTAITTAYFYFCQFRRDKTPLDEMELLRAAQFISRAIFVGADDVIRVIEDLPVIQTTEEFVQVLKTHGDTIRFDNFNETLLYTLVNNSWYGMNSREMVAVAMEHPPTFLSLLYYAIYEYGFRGTIIGREVKDNKKGDSDLQFVRNVDHLITF